MNLQSSALLLETGEGVGVLWKAEGAAKEGVPLPLLLFSSFLSFPMGGRHLGGLNPDVVGFQDGPLVLCHSLSHWREEGE